MFILEKCQKQMPPSTPQIKQSSLGSHLKGEFTHFQKWNAGTEYMSKNTDWSITINNSTW